MIDTSTNTIVIPEGTFGLRSSPTQVTGIIQRSLLQIKNIFIDLKRGAIV